MAIATGSLDTSRDRGGGFGGWLRNQPVGRLFVLPALIYAIVVTQAPFVLTLWYSLQRWNLQRPDTRGFAGLDNYRFLLDRDPAFWEAVANTVLFTVSAVVASLLLGLLFAELVNHRFPGRNVVRTLLITPFLVMPTAAALTWKNMMLNPIFGVVNWVTRGLPGSPSPNWLGNHAEVSVVGVVVWRWAPFMMLILLAGMQAISEEIREAARVDGASPLQEFLGITLPNLTRFMVLGGLLGTVYIIQEVDAIYMMTQGGPSNATTTLPFLTYRKAIPNTNVGQGAAAGVIMVLFSIVLITLLVRFLDRLMRGQFSDGRD